jgi:hypothetical protein
MAENSTEAEIDAAAFLGKILRWMVLFMSDLGWPFQGPIPIAEDKQCSNSYHRTLWKNNKERSSRGYKNIGITSTGPKQNSSFQCHWNGG